MAGATAPGGAGVGAAVAHSGAVTPLTRGENRPLSGDQVTVAVTGPAPVDVSALLLGASGRVRGDRDLVFFNSPVGDGVTLHHGQGRGDAVRVDLRAVPDDVGTVVVTASLDGTGPATFGQAGPLVATVGPETFEIAGLGSESAVVCVEVYRRHGGWRVRAVGQGYDTGLAGIAAEYGVQLDDDAPAPPEPTTPPTAPSPPEGAPPMQSDLFSPEHAEVGGSGIQKQGGKMARVSMTGGELLARAGSMVAYQGDLRFEALGSGGIGNMIRQRLTGEGVPLMKVTGRGDLFLANAASDVHLIDLDGSDGLTINGANVLAFDPSLSYGIERVSGAAGYAGNAGLFNCEFTGRGRIAITTEGTPVVLEVDQPTYADPQAAVAWSASLRTGLTNNDTFTIGTLMGRSTGERYTLSFTGHGFVIVQPSELPPGGLVGGTGGGEQAGQGGGVLGGLLGGR